MQAATRASKRPLSSALATSTVQLLAQARRAVPARERGELLQRLRRSRSHAPARDQHGQQGGQCVQGAGLAHAPSAIRPMPSASGLPRALRGISATMQDAARPLERRQVAAAPGQHLGGVSVPGRQAITARQRPLPVASTMTSSTPGMPRQHFLHFAQVELPAARLDQLCARPSSCSSPPAMAGPVAGHEAPRLQARIGIGQVARGHAR
jgi:hypothetical protein